MRVKVRVRGEVGCCSFPPLLARWLGVSGFRAARLGRTKQARLSDDSRQDRQHTGADEGTTLSRRITSNLAEVRIVQISIQHRLGSRTTEATHRQQAAHVVHPSSGKSLGVARVGPRRRFGPEMALSSAVVAGSTDGSSPVTRPAGKPLG